MLAVIASDHTLFQVLCIVAAVVFFIALLREWSARTHWSGSFPGYFFWVAVGLCVLSVGLIFI